MATRGVARGLALLLAAALASGARAEDGQIEINQAIARAGGVNGDLVADPPGFPVEITRPGSYRLTSDLSGAGTGNLISAGATDDVTIDLAGHTLRHEGVCSGIFIVFGVVASGANTVVRNGTLRNVHGPAIRLEGPSARVERVRVIEGCSSGVWVGEGALVTKVAARANGNAGIRCGAYCRVVDGIADDNGSSGIDVGPDSIVSGSVAVGNAYGIYTGAGSVIVESTASLNLLSGIVTGYASNLIGVAANQNRSYGLSLTPTSAAGWGVADGNAIGTVNLGIAHGCNLLNGVASCPTHP